MRRLAPFLCFVLLAGCGGRGMTLPPLSPAPGEHGTSAARSTSSLGSVPAGTLYVAGLDHVGAFALSAIGFPAPDRTITNSNFYRPSGPGLSGARIAAISTGAASTLDVLTDVTSSGTSSGCGIYVYAFDANGAANPQSAPCDFSHPIGISGRPSGAIDYLSMQPPQTDAIERDRSDGTTLLRVMFAPPFNSHRGLAEDAAADVYVSVTNPSRVDVFPTAGAGVSGTRSRTFSVSGTPGAIAVSPADGTIYVASNIAGGSSPLDVVYAYDSGATAPSRTIGPFPNRVSALVVDDQGELFVGITNLDNKGNKIRVYASDANGQAVPLRTIMNPIPYNGTVDAVIVGLAIAAPYPPVPAQEAYVEYSDHVDIYPLSANGVVLPSRTITGMAHPYSGIYGNSMWWNEAIVVGGDGSLYAFQDERVDGPYFAAVKYLPGANGAAPAFTLSEAPQQYPQQIAGLGNVYAAALDPSSFSVALLDGGYGDVSNEIDELAYAGTPAYTPHVWTASRNGIATDAAGARYTIDGYRAYIDVYDRGVQDNFQEVNPHETPATPSRTIGALAPNDGNRVMYGLARGADGTIYVGIASLVNLQLGGPNYSIAAFAPGAGPASVPSRTITGSFTAPFSLAVDSAGDLLVLHADSVQTYAPNADGAARPIRGFNVQPESMDKPSALAIGPAFVPGR